jgi:SAM-dependent methyltransferase
VTATDKDAILAEVKSRYATAAREAQSCCGTSGSAEGLIGASLYAGDDADALPEAALAASLGCGNPTMLAELKPGQVVLDLGSGGGIDVLLSARRVGPSGKAYGLDMTPEMLELARRNQKEAGVENAEFLEGTIEAVPLPDASVDVVISNCVVNLSPDKPAVLREASRVLRDGGLFAISDIVLRRELSKDLIGMMGLWTGCVVGALTHVAYTKLLREAGFRDVEIVPTQVYERGDLVRMAGDDAGDLLGGRDPEAILDELEGAVMSAFVRARKPY